MKKVILFALAGLICLNAGAQWKVVSIDESEDFSIELKAVLELDDAVLVYGTYTATVDYDRASFDPGTAVVIGEESYPLKNSLNIPLNDGGEPCSAAFNKAGEKANFVMEFEKFPLDGKFDIVENAKNHKGSSNIYGIALEPTDTEFFENTESFLEEYPVTLMGYYYEGNIPYAFRIRNNICITCNCIIRERDLFEPLDRLYFMDVINRTDHDIFLDYDKVWVSGHKRKNDGGVTTTKIKHYTLGGYGEYEQEMEGAEGKYSVAGIRDLSYELRQAKYDQTNALAVKVIGIIGKKNSQLKVEDYLAEYPTKHLSSIRSTSIPSGQSAGGFMATQEKDGLGYYICHVDIDGYVFAFVWK